jgi:HPt (histidine-containing phosphotransfer) domain-containing protein
MANIDREIFDSMSRVLRASGQLEQIIQSFCSNCEDRVAVIFRSIDKKDPHTIISTAHALKGSCSMFGAKSCADLCQQIENSTTWSSTPANYNQIRQLTETLSKELNEIKQFLRCQVDPGKPECCP